MFDRTSFVRDVSDLYFVADKNGNCLWVPPRTSFAVSVCTLVRGGTGVTARDTHGNLNCIKVWRVKHTLPTIARIPLSIFRAFILLISLTRSHVFRFPRGLHSFSRPSLDSRSFDFYYSAFLFRLASSFSRMNFELYRFRPATILLAQKIYRSYYKSPLGGCILPKR